MHDGVCRRGAEHATYTQWEAWLAIALGKDLLLVEPAETVARGPKFAPTARRRPRGRHRTRLKAIDRYPGPPFRARQPRAQIVTSSVLVALAKARSEIEVQERAFRLWTFAFGPAEKPATEPSLDRLNLADAFEDGAPNIFSLMRWDFGLVETLYGRSDDPGRF